MLIKAFELKREFPFPMHEGILVIDRERLTPTSMNRAMAINNKEVRVIKPGLKGDIMLYGVTHGQDTMHMVVLSTIHETRYYWFSRKRQYTYKVPMASKDLSEAWMNLFKAFIVDTHSKVIGMYDIFKHFTLEYFKTLGETEIKLSLSATHEGELHLIEVEKTNFMNRVMQITVGDQTRLVDFNRHPLLEVLGK